MGQIFSKLWGERNEKDGYGSCSCESEILLVVIIAFLICVIAAGKIRLLSHSKEASISL